MVNRNNIAYNNKIITEQCLKINLDINGSLSNYFLTEHEISFDHLIPFLFDDIPNDQAFSIAKELVLHRNIIDLFNKGIQYPNEFIDLIEKNNYLKPTTFSEYQNINNNYRTLIDNDIIKSYLISTKRVFYRFEILNKLNINNKNKTNILVKVKSFSAFLLFDDDIYDLEEDLKDSKSTILIQFLENGNLFDTAIKNMLTLISNVEPEFNIFTKQFKEIYL